MSVWRLMIRELADLGGVAIGQQLACPHWGREEAAKLGLVTSAGTCRRRVYSLTPLGWDVVSGRVMREAVGNGGRGQGKSRWRATWLAALPRPGQVQVSWSVAAAEQRLLRSAACVA